MNDNELLDLIYEDSVSGVTELVDTYAGLVYKIVCEVLSDAAPEKYIDECIADSFVAFYDNADDVDLSRGSIKAYLAVIAKRRATNLYYTLTSDDEAVFPEYTVEELSEILENEELVESTEVADRIKVLCFQEIAPDVVVEEFSDEPIEETEDEAEVVEEEPEEFEEPEESEDESEVVEIIKRKASPLVRVLKTLVAMVTLVTVITGAVIAFDRLSASKQETTTTTTTQPSTQHYDPLLSAIMAGNEKLIEELITNSLLLSQDILKYAVESADKISYDSIRHIAEEVKKKYGSTGLEPILEGAIFGDFQSVMDKLKNKDESEMTPAEKLAYFFATTFGPQAG